MMHREKKHLVPLVFRQSLDHGFLISIFIHLLKQPGAQPLFFPGDPSLRQPLPQVALFHLAWHHRISAHRMKGTTIKDNQTAWWHITSAIVQPSPSGHFWG